jgi:hypothetical protein
MRTRRFLVLAAWKGEIGVVGNLSHREILKMSV